MSSPGNACVAMHLDCEVDGGVSESGAARHALVELAAFRHAVVQEGGLVGVGARRQRDARPQDDALGVGVTAGHALIETTSSCSACFKGSYLCLVSTNV